ncbi:Zn-dependent exopeptidase [Linderina pennispora]|uniref:Zn-dependent exopeptidase n=1 Tax=Linderina pennispora TaxID=61395 RepID=A0A1Y1WB21_9FUNG|nr:Zn-dependent exopeptidase [Linderina pennispora]ORX70737.1 Zn-dependent exopeptidase [Linderina pennispora]
MALPKITAHTELSALSAIEHDALVAVYTDLDSLSSLQSSWASAIEPYRSIDKDFGQTVALVPSGAVGGNRLVLSPTGSLNDDTDDVRKIGEAAKAGIARAIEAGAKRPALVLAQAPPSPAEAPLDADYSRWIEVALLGALEASYVTLVVREFRESSRKGELENLDSIDLVVPGVIAQDCLKHVITRVRAIEAGRRLAKDVGYGDPERMTPYKCAEYIEQTVKGVKGIEYEEIKDLEVLKNEYPLLYHSSRASLAEKKTWPCIVKLAYKSPDPTKVKEHLYLVGKGVTYDTGGISLKIGAAMRGMSRDKLGACGLAGFVLATGLVEEPSVDITCILAFERNSIGPNALLPDEVVVSRAGVRVLIGDTDAEGRLVMTDAVCECREKILAARAAGDYTPSAIYTAATLTGHVIRAYGWYGAAVANGPARKEKWDHRLLVAGLAYGDPFENSVMRRDDHQFIASKTDREDVYQSNCNPSTQTDRGHQYPAAFIIKASGLDKHSLSAGKDAISFIHVDIAGSAEDGVEPGLGLMGITGSPVATFAGAFWTA